MSPHATIIAIASPPGRSLRGIIRISGADAFALIDRVTQSTADASFLHVRGHRRLRLTLSATQCFSVWAFQFPAPHSYTGDDSIELQVPGNPALLARVVDALMAASVEAGLDVRRAEPGEFTARAFLNGRLDLTQAEGVAATIAAQSDAELAAAGLLTSGRLGATAHALADDLAAGLALVEAGIDFTDQDDVVAIAPRDLSERLLTLRQRLDEQLERSVGIEQLRAIPWVVLVGEPNAGKSALFNALLGRERAVVSNIPGTTRDVLAEPLTIDTAHGRAEVMLVDLAGLDDADPSSMNALMQVAARGAMARAELRLRCVALDRSICSYVHGPMAKDAAAMLVLTKADLREKASTACSEAKSLLATSAATGEGLDNLKAAIADRLSSRAVSLAAGALALQPRHEAAMRSALANIDQAIMLVSPQRSARALTNPELIASSMRAALDDLASLAGEMTPDDILGRIFASFCIGK